MNNFLKQAVGADAGQGYCDDLPKGATETLVVTDTDEREVWYHDGFWYVPFGHGLVPATTPSPEPVSGYPDGNPKSLQGAKKYSLRYLPLAANIAVNQALEDGAKKYGAANWREKGVAASVYVDAALRHLSQYFDGKQDLASDSGVHNLGHAMACLAIIIDAEANGTLTDDRPYPTKDTDALLKRKEV